MLTGLLEFVPYVGPIAAAVPAVLVGLTEGPAVGLYVVLLYVGVQTAEIYLITPLVQERAVYLPPAVIVVFQVLMAVLFGVLGVLGVLLATPLAAVALLVLRRLYVEDALGDVAEGRRRA